MVIEELAINQRDIWYASLDVPKGSEPGYRRPVVIVQADSLNRSRLKTVVCVPLTSNLTWAKASGNVLLQAAETGLEKDGVANCSQIITVDKRTLTEPIGRLSDSAWQLILAAIDIVLGR